ncbi:hypothetical protein NE686_17235 [Tissierella carlieri]|uniref:Yip1 domain-containing protein n=1 Tax=Tissierella carlieri TaxID=689904 RepID=A0ABT1SED4_9FIRM|nr:hypothetical protein [Tissierella carlieri]MCQ4924849.1 hypothetical protein [Tissierella carlieri]
MFINKVISNKKIFIMMVLFILLSSNISFADKNINEMDKKIDKQNEDLYEEILKNQKDGPNILDEIMKESDRKNHEEVKDIDLGRIATGIQRGSILLAVKARKYVVPVTVLILLFNIFMLSATGAKNMKNRKKYIVNSVFFYIFFLLVLNLPLYLLWRSSIGTENLISFDAFYKLVVGISNFLKANSFVFFVIIFTFGMINKISSETNLPKKLASQYMIKMSWILLVFLNFIPFILKLAI